MATKPNPIPTNYRRVTPSLVVKGAKEAIKFYSEAFGATERARFSGSDDTIAHAEIEIGDSVIIVEDVYPGSNTKAPSLADDVVSSFLFIYVNDVDKTIEKAVELGAKLKRPPQDQFYGDRDGYIIDPFGHGWTIASHLEDVSPEEAAHRMEKMMTQS